MTSQDLPAPPAIPSIALRAAAPLVAIVAVAAVALLAPFPDGSLSVAVTSAAASAGLAVPGVELFADGLLIVLAGITAVALLHAWWHQPERRTRVIAAGAGVVLAYLGSETAKGLFGQLRPCTRWAAAAACEVGDYSFPSNHATLAFAAAGVIGIVTGRLLWTAIATILAVAVAAGRLLEGVHYLHDVAAGALWGMTVPVLLVLIVEAVRGRLRARG